MGKSEAKAFVNGQISSHKIVVFSKTYCPFCKMAKQALKDVGAEFLTIELETRDDGSDIQDFLLELTGGRSVPRVFIDGKFIGGGDKTKALKESGELAKLVKA